MMLFDLNGEWWLKQEGGRGRIKATVPGTVHTDLLQARRIPDPFYRQNENSVQWIGETAWIYGREFTVPRELLMEETVMLRSEGLDTYATIKINGRRVGITDNMFRAWEFDVKNVLKAGRNTIEVRFDPVLLCVERMRRKARRAVGDPVRSELQDRSWARKEQCNFGWDWGPKLVTCGIWRSMEIVGRDRARLVDVHVGQRHGRKGVVLDITGRTASAGRRKPTASVAVSFGGRIVGEAEVCLTGVRFTAEIAIAAPRLWWPHGMGDQPLYEVTVDLLAGDGELIDTITRRVGLRTLGLDRKKDRWGESFRFKVNGTPFFAKGANWIPADVFAPRMTLDKYCYLLQSAVDANMNMLRVWGGGIYEEDVFYDLCDELGICVWQDFMFACARYPSFNDEYMANVKAEAEYNVKRLRHHACMALWCGNNELEQGIMWDKWTIHQMGQKDYSKLFDKLLAQVVGRYHPEADYWPSSPHTPVGDRRDFNNPCSGDAHIWDVWHGGQPVDLYRNSQHRFCSEFGFQSFPEPKTVESFTLPGDRSVASKVMEHHQRSHKGNTTIVTNLLNDFGMPVNFEMSLWASQIQQGRAIKYAVEHWRRSMPRCMGAIYWQLNDCWPVASWASIDSHGRWKALHYMARRFFAPVLISGVENAGNGTVDIHVTSDLTKTFTGKVRWTLMTVSGRKLAADGFSVRVGGHSSRMVKKLDVSDVADCLGTENLLVWLELESKGKIVSSNVVTFVVPKRLDLVEPGLSTTVRLAHDDHFMVKIKAASPALWVWLELAGVDAWYSDNFFDVRPGRVVEVEVLPLGKMTLTAFRKKLKLRSMVDLF